jgi:neurotransmitter:Na+ symporter, NSS family
VPIDKPEWSKQDMSQTKKERWGTRLGLVLAVAGNAIGLGNFLRFPRLAAEYGGGSFLVPYFIALVLLGIPVMWIEWSMGRYGGIFGHHSTPGMFARMTKSRWGTIIGSLGVSLPLLFAIYYTYIESWTLAYATFSATGQYFSPDEESLKASLPPEVANVTYYGLLDSLKSEPAEGTRAIGPEKWTGSREDFDRLDLSRDGRLDEKELEKLITPLKSIHTMQFLRDYQGVTPAEDRVHFYTIFTAFAFWTVTVAANCFVLSRGIKGGIELLAKIAMPLLFFFAILLVISVLSMGTPDPSIPTRNVWAGLDFVWKPRFESLLNPQVWLAAAGQIFFTLSIGTGSIQAYSCYLRKDEDTALTGLATVTTNEFAEVVLGATIAIPVAVASFGLVATQAIAASGSFDLGFVAMPVIFQQMPLGRVLGAMWFGLLFFAGITSSVGLCQPVMAFMQEAFGWTRQKSSMLCGAMLYVFGFPIVMLIGRGYLDEYDTWAGTVLLIVLALIETFIFAWIFGLKNMKEELTRGSEIRIPSIFYPIMRYVVPLFLVVILTSWLLTNLSSVLFLTGIPVENHSSIWLARGTILFLIGLFAYLTIISPSLRNAHCSNALPQQEPDHDHDVD